MNTPVIRTLRQRSDSRRSCQTNKYERHEYDHKPHRVGCRAIVSLPFLRGRSIGNWHH